MNLDEIKKEAEKAPEKQKEPEKQPEPDTKTEGIANDIMAGLEPFIRVAEKATNRDRSDFMGKLVIGAVQGKFKQALGGAFGEERKRSRIEKFKDAFQITLWIALLLMLFFWINYGIARWMGII